MPLLSDSWVELGMFSAEHMHHFLKYHSMELTDMKFNRDNLSWENSWGDNELKIFYYPYSISGIRELIVNANGDLILPKAMAKGEAIKGDILGNLSVTTAQNVLKTLPYTNKFDFYWKNLKNEMNYFAN